MVIDGRICMVIDGRRRNVDFLRKNLQRTYNIKKRRLFDNHIFERIG